MHDFVERHEDVAKMSGPVSLFFENDDAWTKGALAIVPLALEGKVIGAIIALLIYRTARSSRTVV